MQTPPTGQTFEIASFSDIFNLPSIEQMERCLDELKQGMVQARHIKNRMLAGVEALVGKAPELAVECFEKFTFIDDGKCEITTLIGDDKDHIAMTTR